MKRNYKKTLEEQVEILYNRMFAKWYSGNDKLFHFSKQHKVPNGSENIKSIIRHLLISGADVRTGYTASSIKGYHNYHIFETRFED